MLIVIRFYDDDPLRPRSSRGTALLCAGAPSQGLRIFAKQDRGVGDRLRGRADALRYWQTDLSEIDWYHEIFKGRRSVASVLMLFSHQNTSSRLKRERYEMSRVTVHLIPFLSIQFSHGPN